MFPPLVDGAVLLTGFEVVFCGGDSRSEGVLSDREVLCSRGAQFLLSEESLGPKVGGCALEGALDEAAVVVCVNGLLSRLLRRGKSSCRLGCDMTEGR